MKRIKVLFVTLTIAAATTFPALAEWKTEEDGRWWYQNEDGSYPANQWQEIDGKQYYFDTEGYMLANTTTPDGKQVGEDGAMVQENKQTQPMIINVDGLNPQQNGYIVTYQYFKAYEEYGSTKYQSIIEIQNTSSGNLYLGNATFDIYDRSNNIVASETLIFADPDVIAPREKGYFYSNGGYLDNVPMGDYFMRPTIKVEKTSLQAIRFPVSGTSIKTTSFGKNISVVGKVTNDSDKNESILWIDVVLFDKNNIPIGIYGTNILDFNSGKTIGFEAEGWHLPNHIKSSDVERYEVIAAPHQYQF